MGQKRHKWGWGIAFGMNVLLALNGVLMFFVFADPNTFEQDTGENRDEVAAAYPGVVDHVMSEGRLISTMLLTLGVFAAVVSWAGWRGEGRWPWDSLWVIVALHLYVGVEKALAAGRVDIGSVYLTFGVLLAAGLLITGRPERKPTA